jgi:Uma2 family endonuclease
MTPGPARVHADISVEILRQMLPYFAAVPANCILPLLMCGYRKAGADKSGTVVQPDILVVCDPSKLDEKGCRGAPDLVIEVLSPSTARKMQSRKGREKHGCKSICLPTPQIVW